MNIAFFDFDNTLVKGDSLMAFLQFYYEEKKLYFLFKILLFLPFFLAFKIKVLSRNNAKEKLFILFFKGERRSEFLKKAEQFSKNWIPKNIKEAALLRLKWHQKQQDKIVIVSASIEAYLAPFAEKENLNLIATKLDLSSEIMSGKFIQPNCYGQEKVNQIQKIYALKDFDSSYAYGDSKGDKEMLAMVDQPFYQKYT